jgi:hypothetical protein
MIGKSVDECRIMNCFDFENYVNELLDQRQTELLGELSAHAACCAQCHELWVGLHQLQFAIDDWRQVPITVPLADQVLKRLPTEFQTTVNAQILTTRPACSPLTGFVVLMASAATLLIALGIGWRVSSNATYASRPSSSATAITANRSEAPASPLPTTDRQLDALLHDARNAYLALATQAWQEVSTANVLIPPADSAIPSSGDDPAVTAPETLSRPLVPYGKELRDTVDSWLLQIFQNQDSST